MFCLPRTLKTELGKELKWHLADLIQSRNEILEIELQTAYGSLAKTKSMAWADISINIDVRGSGIRKPVDIEAMYLYTGKGWSFSLQKEPCPKTEVGKDGYSLSHFTKSPSSKASPGAWIPLVLSGRKKVWNVFSGEDLKEQYLLAGTALLEIVTSEGICSQELNLRVEVEELPF